MKAQVITLDAKKAGDIDLDDGIFGLPERGDILQRVVVWQLAKRRAGTHKVQSRGEVAGTTKRIGKQKGGGTARHGAGKLVNFAAVLVHLALLFVHTQRAFQKRLER